MLNKERENAAWISCLMLPITIWYSIRKVWLWFTFQNVIQKTHFPVPESWFKDSEPSSSHISSVEDPLIAPVMASVALFWSDSSLAWKDSLNFLSYIISQ